MRANRVQTKTYWVTGASNSLGLALIRQLAVERNFIFVSARDVTALGSLERAFPDNIQLIEMDTSSASSVKRATDVLTAHTDHIDVLITDASTLELDDHCELEADHFERVTRHNYLGIVETVRVALPLLNQSQQCGQIVSFSSLAALLPFPRAAAYGASQVALEYFLKCLRVEIKSQGIDLMIVRAGFEGAATGNHGDEFVRRFKISKKQAVTNIIEAMERRKAHLDLPKRVSLPLQLLRFTPNLWSRNFAPKFRKPKLI